MFRKIQSNINIFVIIAAILLSLGVLGGWVIGGQQELQQGEIASHSVRLLLSALTTNFR
ncbi:hypothetical protein [Nostoc sp.]|uniref:hypothetical protein n=1 Tax=Nostoc sp. TaxID=1180 RepID=UPI002FFBC954